jgi:putative transposase
MAKYYRNYVPGGTYFFTVVTYHRRAILTSDQSRATLRSAFRSVKRRWPFTVEAIVLLPEHLHAVWTLPPDDADYSLRWQKIKECFTAAYVKTVASGGVRRGDRGERNVWQPRFWEHTCREGEDLKRCVDYVHYNPLKHGLVTSVRDWRWSSFHRYLRLGEYAYDWGSVDPCPNWNQPEFEP